MKLEMRIGEAEATVTATPCDTEGRYRIEVGDETWEGEIFVREGHGLMLMAPEGPMEAWVARSHEGLWIWCDGRARLVQAGGAGRGRRRGAGASVAREVTPPMPAVVMSLLVGQGDLVTKGQGLVVVSAMKMEMTLVAPFDGTVVAIRTEVGAKVNPGEILVDITPAAPEKGEASEGREAPEKGEASEGPEAPEKGEASEGPEAPEKGEAPEGREAPEKGEASEGREAPEKDDA